jgi:hypothetical protein
MTEQPERDAAIRLIAENQFRRYDNEFDASHLSWVDFEPSARADIDALASAGHLVFPEALKPRVTRADVRAAAHALFMWNNEVAGDPRFVLHHVTQGVDREPYGALVDEVLHHLGIPVQEGRES